MANPSHPFHILVSAAIVTCAAAEGCFTQSFLDQCGYTTPRGTPAFLTCIARGEPLILKSGKIDALADVAFACGEQGGKITGALDCMDFRDTWGHRPAGGADCPAMRTAYMQRCCPARAADDVTLRMADFPRDGYGWFTGATTNMVQAQSIRDSYPLQVVLSQPKTRVGPSFIVVLHDMRKYLAEEALGVGRQDRHGRSGAVAGMGALVDAMNRASMADLVADFESQSAWFTPPVIRPPTPAHFRFGRITARLAYARMLIADLSPVAVAWLAQRPEVRLIEPDYPFSANANYVSASTSVGGSLRGSNPRAV